MSGTNQEILVGRKAARKLQKAITSIIAVETVESTGALMKTTARAKKAGNTNYLDRITIASPHYGFKLNYGFEGIKSNRVQMNLKPINHLHKAIERTSILNELADNLSNIRAEEVAAKINF